MNVDAHSAIVPSRVRGGLLPRHATFCLEDARIYALSEGLGLPRTWSMATDAVLTGFEQGVRESVHGGAARLEDGVQAARHALTQRSSGLLERIPVDGSLLAVLVEGAELHVVAVGTGRVYVHGAGKPERLTPRNDAPAGLLRAPVARSKTTLEPGNLVLIGSTAAYSKRGIDKLATILTQAPSPSAAAVAAVLVEPAAEVGAAACAIAVRLS